MKSQPETNTAGTAGPVQSVARTFTLLELVIAAEEIGLSELAERSGLSLGTTHRLVAALVAAGYVTKDIDSGRYILGGQFVQMAGQVATRGGGPGESATIHLLKIRDEFDETVNLVALDGWKVRYVDQVESSRPVRMFNQIGNRVDLHASAAGKAILATQPDRFLKAFFERAPFERMTPGTIVDADKMSKELDQIRQRGFAIDHQERDQGVICVAAAIPSPRGAASHALSVSGPAERMSSANLELIGKFVLTAAVAIANDGRP